MTTTGPAPSTVPAPSAVPTPVARPADALVGAVAAGRDTAFRAAEYGAAVVGATARLAWLASAPLRALVPLRYQAVARDVGATVEAEVRRRLTELAVRGETERRRQAVQASELLDRLVPLVVAEVVARIDLTRLVTENVDLDAVAARVDVDAIADRVDTDRIVERLDLAAITDQVLDEIDLPEIMRSSTGSLASNVVVGVRKRGIDADDAVAGIVDRLLRRDRR